MLAYLCVVNNPADDLRLRRIINKPAPGHRRQHHRASAPAIAGSEGCSAVSRSSAMPGTIPELQQSRRQTARSSPI